ncbi:hypothetical protein BGZ94_006900 [Podila epigama]|nr:hypothetical protein BGZ94_006900 [Podila epigama]
MTETATSRALEIPEIVHRIGWFIPLWQLRPYYRPALHAKDLLACVQVNRLWNTTLSPLLWTLFVARKDRDIPDVVIQANKHHIRYISLYEFVGPIQHLHITQLKGLTLHELQKTSCCTRLLLNNPNLQQLSLSADTDYEHRIEYERFSQFLQALQSLTKLEYLDIGISFRFPLRKEFDATLLRTILFKNRGLKDLSFYFEHPLARCDCWESLPWIEKLYLCTTNLDNGALQLLQHCPNITTLELTLFSRHWSWDDINMAMGGAGGRPRLTHLKLRNPRKDLYNSFEIDLEVNKALRILKTTTSLVTLKLFFNISMAESCKVIIDYCSNTLQYLSVYFHVESMDTVSSVNKILRSCPKLRRLSIHGPNFSQLWFDLFEPRWDAPKLESLKFKMNVKKRVIDYAGDNYDLGDLYDFGDPYDLDLRGWQQEEFLEELMNSNSQSFVAGSENSPAPDIYDEGSKVGLDRPTVDILIDMFEQYYERERQLIASIKDNGWRVSSDYNKLDTNWDLQHFRDLLLETALTIPSLRTVRLNCAVFCRI